MGTAPSVVTMIAVPGEWKMMGPEVFVTRRDIASLFDAAPGLPRRVVA